MTEPCTTCGGEGVTLEQVEALIAEATAVPYVLWPGADWMPATGRVFPGKPLQDGDGLLTGVWEGYNLTGIDYQPGVDTTACRTLLYPSSWASVTVNALILAGAFGSGVTRWYRSGNPSTAVDITLGPSFLGPMFENVPGGFDLGAVGGPAQQFLQMPISRQGDVDVFAQSASVLMFYGTEGV